MKICIIGTTVSSILLFRKELIKHMLLNGHSVYTFLIDISEQNKHLINELGVISVKYSMNPTGINPIADIFSTLTLRKKINQINPDIVFSYFSKPTIFGSLVARMTKVPRVVAMLEGLGYPFSPFSENKIDKLKKNVIKLVQISLYKLSFNFSDRLIFLNPSDPAELIEKHKINIKDYKILGGIGVNLNDYPYVPPVIKPVSFIFIGRLLRDKGIFEFIRAAELVKQQHPEVKFIMLGAIDKNNPSGLREAKINRLLKDDTIIYPGHVNNVQEWINNSSVFVLPSYREGVPRSTQEAMAIGRAVITTDAPGCRETVEDGVNGFLIPPQNIEALAKKMIFFIKNPEQIILMGKKSREKAENEFCAITQTEKLFNLIVND